MTDSDIYIYDAVRTPRGKGKAATASNPGGSLSEVAPQALVATLVDAVRQRCPEFEHHLSHFALGCVGQVTAQGGHIALISKLASQLPDEVSVQSINNHCVSSLTAMINAVGRAQDGAHQLLLAGGVESMSQVGFLADNASYYTDADTRRALKWAPPVLGAELMASLYDISKSDLDEITLQSHQRADSAWNSGFYDDVVVPVMNKDGQTLLAQDELIRSDLDADSLNSLAPAFAEQGASGFDDMLLKEYPELAEISHVHSIANCPGMADGASLVLLGSKQAGSKSGLTAKAKIVAMAEVAGSPILQLDAGMKAMDMVLTQSRLTLNQFDCIEFMEAFAAIPAVFFQRYRADSSKVNQWGGHLAMGHPMGATGTILVGHAVNQLMILGGQFALVVGTAGGGLGTALVLERV